MTSPDDAAKWRNRFIVMNLIRIGSTIGVIVCLLLWQSDVFVRGGTIIGLPLGLCFLVASFFGPKVYASRWREPPNP
jgi:hypothetical protein